MWHLQYPFLCLKTQQTRLYKQELQRQQKVAAELRQREFVLREREQQRKRRR